MPLIGLSTVLRVVVPETPFLDAARSPIQLAFCPLESSGKLMKFILSLSNFLPEIVHVRCCARLGPQLRIQLVSAVVIHSRQSLR